MKRILCMMFLMVPVLAMEQTQQQTSVPVLWKDGAAVHPITDDSAPVKNDTALVKNRLALLKSDVAPGASIDDLSQSIADATPKQPQTLRRSPLATMSKTVYSKEWLPFLREQEEERYKKIVEQISVGKLLSSTNNEFFDHLSERNGLIPDYYDHGNFCTIV